MTDKITLNDIATVDNSIINAWNANNDIIEAAVNEMLSLNGVAPNQMNCTLDMNSNAIINLPAPVSVSSPARLQDLPLTGSVTIASVPSIGTSGSNVGLLNTNNTYSGNNTHSGNNTLSGTNTFSGSNSFSGTTTFSNTVTEGATTFSGSSSGTTVLQASAVASGTLTLPAVTDTLVAKTTTDTLTNKTLTSPHISTIINTGTLTLPTSTDTLIGRSTTDTLTNKTLTSPTLTTPSIGVATGTSVAVTGKTAVFTGTSIPAGGTSGTGYLLSATSNFGIFFGSGLPTLSAAKGSLYLRSDGSSTTTRMYINTDGGSTWTNVVTTA
jgi:hypothetical protein